MKWIFEIDGEDYTDVISAVGMTWTLEFLDSEDSGRNQNYTMDRPEVHEARQLKFEGREKVTFERFHALALAVRKKFFAVRYVDVVEGVTERNFYAAEITGRTMANYGGVLYYNNISLTVTEKEADALIS